MAEIGQMTLHDVKRLSDYARANPTLRQLVAACAYTLGVKLPEPESEKPKPVSIEAARAWAAQANAGMRNG